MTFPKPAEPHEHGSTVLPGVPLPASAHPQPGVSPPARSQSLPAPPAAAAPAPVAAPPSAAADVSPVESPPVPVRGRHAAVSPQEPEKTEGANRLMLLAIAGLVVVLTAAAAFLWPGFLLSFDDSAAPTPGPSASSPSITLMTPATIEGMRRFSGAADKALAESVGRSSVEGLTDPVSAVYGKGTTPVVQVIAWHAVSPPVTDTVTAAFTGFESSTGAQVSAVREVTASGLSGHMECGLVTVKATKTLQCFWADEFSVGSVTVLTPKDRDTATITATAVRAAVETPT